MQTPRKQQLHPPGTISRADVPREPHGQHLYSDKNCPSCGQRLVLTSDGDAVCRNEGITEMGDVVHS